MPPPLIKVETFLTPPPVWIEKLTAMKQVCVVGKVRYRKPPTISPGGLIQGGLIQGGLIQWGLIQGGLIYGGG